MTPELLTDGLLILLLIATIAVVVRLERRLGVLHSAQAAMATSIGALQTVTQRAEAAIQGLRNTADEGGAQLDGRIKRARAIADELSMLLGAAEKSGDRFVSERSRSSGAPETFATAALRALGGTR